MLRPPSVYVLAALCALLVGLTVYGESQRRRAVAAEAESQGLRGTVAVLEAEAAGLSADVDALRDHVAVQNAGIDSLAAAGDRQRDGVRTAAADAARVRAATQVRVDSVLVAPAPATCEGAVELLAASVPDLLSSW